MDHSNNHLCLACDAEFIIEADVEEQPSFCPFCGSELDFDVELEEDEDE